MNIPKALRIRGKEWRVKIHRRIPGTWGWAEYATRTIHLDGSLSKRNLEVTFVHEVLHACAARKYVSAEHEELFVEGIDEALTTVLARAGAWRK